MSTKKALSVPEAKALVGVLEARFEKNKVRYKGFVWSEVLARLEANPSKLWSLHEMERTGGEPALITQDPETGGYVFYDCSSESPLGRRSLCYDHEALEARKANKPENSALEMAAEMGIELLTEQQYRTLQEFGQFDLKTSSWVATPPAIRKLGGALFCDRRYNHIFTYHNGAESYYAARGFRGSIRI